jgi:hypothetical protein
MNRQLGWGLEMTPALTKLIRACSDENSSRASAEFNRPLALHVKSPGDHLKTLLAPIDPVNETSVLAETLSWSSLILSCWANTM